MTQRETGRKGSQVMEAPKEKPGNLARFLGKRIECLCKRNILKMANARPKHLTGERYENI